MPSPLGMTLMSMGQPSASCGRHQARFLEGLCFLRALAPSVGLRPSSLPTATHGGLPSPDLRPWEPSATCSDGQSAPWEPGGRALGHPRGLLSQPRSLKCVSMGEAELKQCS